MTKKNKPYIIIQYRIFISNMGILNKFKMAITQVVVDYDLLHLSQHYYII